ncbi:zinc ribbon domain-containing protein [Halomarina oriensis]|uniref:ACP synthase n=1 Tax=Halomarina oriensis TaxID=671145 RepID=A0A6B0GVD2_9EURY|nr:zinc ribbon domain-containing protein [Halomarina oriensis]MWG35678.1 ACP synthase [Halomarina oriensis]
MTRPTIRAVGGYAPARRLSADAIAEAWGSSPSGIESTAIPAADEDALTMGVAAAKRALDAGDVAPDELDWLGFATTTPPMAEGDLLARLASMLDLREDATLRLYTGDARAGTAALLDAPESGLAVVADCPRGEPDDDRGHAAGAGAAAFVIGADGPASVVDHATHAEPAPGVRFREAGSDRIDGLGVTGYDRSAFTGPVAAASEAVTTADADAVAITAPDGKRPYRAAGALGVESDAIRACAVVHDLGDLGAAGAPLALARALAAGHEAVLCVGVGGGGADVLRVEASGDLPTSLALDAGDEVDYAHALRLRGELSDDAAGTGAAYVTMPTWNRSLPQRHRLVAGRCPDCGALAFPPEGACPDCRELVEYEETRLAEIGTVEAATRIGQGGAPPEFAPQQKRGGAFGVVVVRFAAADGDGAVSLPGQTVGEVDVDDEVRGVLRRLYTQEGVTRYGTKFERV